MRYLSPKKMADIKPDGVSWYACSDGVECCALRWSINYFDRELADKPQKYKEAVEPMRAFLQRLYDSYETGEIPCSRCEPSEPQEPSAEGNES